MAPAFVPAAAVLTSHGLCHRYGTREVLRGVGFEVRRGEVLGLLGPNGSGKSTVIGICAGLVAKQQGTITFEGVPTEAIGRRMRARIGVVFQSPSVDSRLSARQNLLLTATLHCIGGAEARDRVQRQLDLAGLTARADEPVSNFSGGMARRLDLARALLHEPRLLLMDEPTAGLDESSFRQTWDRLDSMRAGRNLSILVSTHRPEEAERCDRVAVLADGRIRLAATPRALRERVSGDVVVIRGEHPADLCREVQERFHLPCLLDRDEVLIEHDRGHELIPRLVEAWPQGRLTSVSLRQPSLGDVFLKLTGHALDEREGAAPSQAGMAAEVAA